MHAFIRAGKTGKPVFLADRTKPLPPSGEQLMRIALVADVPNNFICGRMKNFMECHGKFHHAQIGIQMPAVFGKRGNELFSYFPAQAFKLKICLLYTSRCV